MTQWYNKTSKCQHSRNRQVITHIHSHMDTCVSTGKTHVQTQTKVGCFPSYTPLLPPLLGSNSNGRADSSGV